MSRLRHAVGEHAKATDLLTVQDAARLLGVSVPTLRRWDDAGKFPAKRHPINGYRLYRRADVIKLKKQIAGRVG